MSFIRDDQIQAGIVSYLKGQATVTAKVTAVEIREDQWQGIEFSYPNVRVRLTGNRPYASCYHDFDCGVQVFTEDASSQQAEEIAGIIGNTLHEKGFTSNGIAFLTNVTSLIPAVRSDMRTWRSEVLIHGTAAG
jgi:hypothetical protein